MLLFLTQRICYKTAETTLHGGQPRLLWSAKKGRKEEKCKVWYGASPPSPVPTILVRREKLKEKKTQGVYKKENNNIIWSEGYRVTHLRIPRRYAGLGPSRARTGLFIRLVNHMPIFCCRFAGSALPCTRKPS